MGYTNAQLREILRQAGWPELLIPIMAAIGQSESSGDPTSYRNCPGNGFCTVTQGGVTRTVREVAGQGPETSAGLWQVNLRAHPQYTAAWLRDPVNSAKAALEIYKNEGLKAWGSFTDGGYKKYFNGTAPAGVETGGLSLPGVSAVGDVLGIGALKSYIFDDRIASGMERFESGGFLKSGLVSPQNRILFATAIIVIVVAFTWREFR